MSARSSKRHRPRVNAEQLALPRRGALTRQAILDAAVRFLRDEPFRDLSVALLMAEAGASRATFYQYFEDIYDLMRTLLDDVRGGILEAAEPWFSKDINPAQALRRSLQALVEVGVEKGPILRAVAEAAPFDAELERAWNSFLAHFDTAVAARIEQHQERGLISAFPARAVAVALNRMDAAVLIKEFGTSQRGDPSLVADSLCRIWLSTLYGNLS
jgi:AcrR family transcriptional regulator